VDIIQLKANLRKEQGKGAAGVMRRQGRVPAVLYGPGETPVMLSVFERDLNKALKKGSIRQMMFNLTIENGEKSNRTVMIKELQSHPVSRDLLHVDFYKIAMDRKLRIRIPVVAKGHAPGEEIGGILQIVRREIDILCLPMEVPETIEIDVSTLGMGESIHANEIPLPENIELAEDANYTVVTVSSPKAEAAPEAEEEEGMEEAGEGVSGEDKNF